MRVCFFYFLCRLSSCWFLCSYCFFFLAGHFGSVVDFIKSACSTCWNRAGNPCNSCQITRPQSDVFLTVKLPNHQLYIYIHIYTSQRSCFLWSQRTDSRQAHFSQGSEDSKILIFIGGSVLLLFFLGVVEEIIQLITVMVFSSAFEFVFKLFYVKACNLVMVSR